MDFDERLTGRRDPLRVGAVRLGHVAQIVTFSTIKGRQALRDSAGAGPALRGRRPGGQGHAAGDTRPGGHLAQALEPSRRGGRVGAAGLLLQSRRLCGDCTPATPTPAGSSTPPAAWRACARQDSITTPPAVVDLPQADHRHRPHTAERGRGRGRHPVRDARHRGPGPAQDGLPGPAQPVHHRAGARTDRGEHRGRGPTSTGLPSTTRRSTPMLSRGDAMGIFQLEGGGMRALMRSLRPDRFEDIMPWSPCTGPAHWAPGPTTSTRPEERRAPGGIPPSQPRERARRDVRDHGVPGAGDQAAQIMAGYSMVEADTASQGDGQEDPGGHGAAGEQFVQGCRAHGSIPGVAVAPPVRADLALTRRLRLQPSPTPPASLIAYRRPCSRLHLPADVHGGAAHLGQAATRTAPPLPERVPGHGLRVLVPDR